ncbi:MAG: 3,4-dihydroxyphenylacetate 2,3-dioxygenase [Rhodobacteraceae bacterium]|nr:3,4-dihydroxyphenylacetate 2,3-dioxygenase [Paracoccaceae bacterium]
MMLPPRARDLPFAITRASHVALAVADLDRSLTFYREVVGLALSDRVGPSAYLRGVEENSHHSLVLTQAADPSCGRLGFRVRDAADLDRMAAHLSAQGLDPLWNDRPFQGRTLQLRDPAGIPIEFCAAMPLLPRLHSRVVDQRGAPALRFDHTQVCVTDVLSACRFYSALGFAVSDYSFTPKQELVSAFMHCKDNPHDIVLASRAGPRLHHFGYVVDPQALLRVGDMAANLGMRRQVEYGPSRHGQDHASFVYLRDPDGHRIELLTHPIQLIPGECPPIGRDVTDRDQFVAWGQPVPASFLNEATLFPGEAVADPVVTRSW